MSEFAPVVRAIDVHAAKVKNARKEQKLKNLDNMQKVNKVQKNVSLK